MSSCRWNRISWVKNTISIKCKILWFLILRVFGSCNNLVLCILINNLMISSCLVMLMLQLSLFEKRWLFLRSFIILVFSGRSRVTWAEYIIGFANVILRCLSNRLLHVRKWTCNIKLGLDHIRICCWVFTIIATRTRLKLFQLNAMFYEIADSMLFLVHIHICNCFRVLRYLDIWKLLTLVFFFFHYFARSNSTTKFFLLVVWEIWLLIERVWSVKASRWNLTLLRSLTFILLFFGTWVSFLALVF